MVDASYREIDEQNLASTTGWVELEMDGAMEDTAVKL